jgi:signal transduction histidine kinase
MKLNEIVNQLPLIYGATFAFSLQHMTDPGKVKLADRLIQGTQPRVLTNSERMLSRSLLVFFIGSAIFVAIDTYLNLKFIALQCAGQMAGAVFYMMLLRKGRVWLAGLLGHLHAIITIFLIAAVFSSASIVHVLLIPALVSLVAVFGSSRKTTTTILLVVTMVVFAILEFGEIRIFAVELPHRTLDITKTVNFFGALIMTFSLVYSINAISERAQAELEDQRAELQDKNSILMSTLSVRDKLVSSLSHDIRGPLNSIYGSLQLLNSGHISDEEWKMLSTKLQPQTKDALDFIENMMRWISSQSGQLKVNKTAYSNEHIQRGVIAVSEPVAHAKNIVFNYSIAKDAIAEADEQMINSVLRNLVMNAVKFTREGGRVDLSVIKNGDRIFYSVIDSGRGMSSAEIDKINNGVMFTSAGTSNEKGHGMGILLSRQFLKIHETELQIQSSEHNGSTFSFSLPAIN